MVQILLHPQTPYPKTIRTLRWVVCFFLLTYAGLFDLAASGVIPLFPDFLLLSPSLSWSSFFQPFTAAATLAYPGFDLSLVFDLFILNFFLAPIYTFVLTFLSERQFIKFLISIIVIGSGVFLSLATLLHTPSSPCSLFGGVSLAVIVFWVLLHRKGQSTLFLAFPISRAWILCISACAALYAPIRSSEWAHVGAIVSMSMASYTWGIMRYRLRSHADALKGLEDSLDAAYRAATRFFQWYLIRPFREWFHKG